MPVPPASRAAACQATDDDAEEGDDAVNDRGEHVADAADNGHDDGADGPEEGFKARYDGTHCECLCCCCCGRESVLCNDSTEFVDSRCQDQKVVMVVVSRKVLVYGKNGHGEKRREERGGKRWRAPFSYTHKSCPPKTAKDA